MIDELQIIKEIVGDLTGAGIWGLVGYIAYSLVKSILAWGIIGWLANKLIVHAFDLARAPVTKAEFHSMEKRLEGAEREKEKVLHAYKIMKEKKDAESTAS